MFKPTQCAWLVAAACALPSYAMNIQPDPQNAGGYVIAAPDLAAVEKTKTANPMYGIWAKALATRSNTIVDAIKIPLSMPSNQGRSAIRITSSGSSGYSPNRIGII